MFRSLIVLIVCLLLSLPAIALTKDTSYLAVFSSLDFSPRDWEDIHPDLEVHAPSWGACFDGFLQAVKKQGHGRHIVIDIQCHGWDTLALYQGAVEDTKGDRRFYSEASMGYVVNHIEKALAGEDIEVCCEACFAGRVYKVSIRGNKPNKIPELAENCNHIPPFPVYGISEDVENYNNFIYLQYAHNMRYNFQDLRTYEYSDRPLKPRNLDPLTEENIIIREGFIQIRSYGVFSR